jgi:L-methionine (R)-S-oxide reductase
MKKRTRLSRVTEGFRGQESAPSPYTKLLVDLKALFHDERDFIANAANCAALLYQRLPDVNWAGFYLLRGKQLVLGPFQGKPACVRIELGSGVCGTAANSRKTIVVPDVSAFAGHIACDAASRSEIVVPLLSQKKLIGVLDLDSTQLSRFEPVDSRGLSDVARLLVKSSELPMTAD